MTLDDEKKLWILQSIETEIRRQGRNPSQVAKMMGAKPSWLWRILRGERGMDLFDFLKLTEVLGVTPRDILKDYPPTPVQPGQKLNAHELAEILSKIIPQEVLETLLEMKKPAH